jgi:small subunit ribosomal protein S17
MHPIYKKFIGKSKKYHAHDEPTPARSATSSHPRVPRRCPSCKRWEVVTDEGANPA